MRLDWTICSAVLGDEPNSAGMSGSQSPKLRKSTSPKSEPEKSPKRAPKISLKRQKSNVAGDSKASTDPPPEPSGSKADNILASTMVAKSKWRKNSRGKDCA